MNNFGTLYYYEVKKILSRKLVWSVFFINVCCSVMFTCADLTGKYYVDGEVADTHYHMFQVDQDYQRALSGRQLDTALLEEMQEAYSKIPDTQERYMLTDEYQTYARPYSEIYNLFRRWTQKKELDELRAWQPDEEALYAARLETMEQLWREQQLTDAEKALWREKEAQEQENRPLTYLYHEGYTKLLANGLNTLSILVQMFVCICMAGVFTDEHTRRTDQLILSGAKGKEMVYWAKIAAGASVSAACAALLSAITFMLVFAVYGAEGFGTSLRFSAYLCSSSERFSVGQVCLIEYGILILTAVFVSVLVLVVSELLHSSIATLAVSVGLLMAGILARIPEQYRVLSQLWDWLPARFLNAVYIFDNRTVPLAGYCLVSWIAVPLCYMLAGLVMVLVGKRIYRNYQVLNR